MSAMLKQADRRPEAALLPRERMAVPAWAVSVVLHASLIALLALRFDALPRGSAPIDTRTVSIILKPIETSRDTPLPSKEEGAAAGEPRPAGAGNHTDNGDLLEVEAPSDPTTALPQAELVIGPGVAADRLQPGLGELTHGASGTPAPGRGQARTSVFGLTGEGYKFVYVFDRSGSMGGSTHSPLEAAKRELLRSLNDLSDIHQFEIVFYNDYPVVMELAGSGRLVFANEQNKRLAAEFVSRVRADGATDHEQALTLALRLRPDVIFFLTDADQPTLNARQLAKIRELNGGNTSINCIEFGLGPSLSAENFLVRLARENGGGHVYFDVSRLKRESR
jgi:hypothetical protein